MNSVPSGHPHDLPGFHDQIADRIARLREARGGLPVYGLEHGLDAVALDRLFRMIGGEIRERGLGDNFRRSCLALVAGMAEVGYDYCGTGTDFWPKAEAAFGAAIGAREREMTSLLFETSHRLHGIRKPVDSPWNRTFRHIAWPITNAVAPREMQRPLARALREAYRTAGDMPDEDALVGRLRTIAARLGSTRLIQWLTDPHLAAAVAWRLLGEADPRFRLADDTLNRVFADLATDGVARRAVATAATLHRRRTQATRPAPLGRARLVLEEGADGQPALLVEMPWLSSDDRTAIMKSAMRSGLRPRLWGLTEPIDPVRLFSGIPIAIGSMDLCRILDEAPPFIAKPAKSETGLAERLADTGPILSMPIVMTRPAAADRFAQTGTRTVPDGPFRLLVRSEAGSPESVASLGMVAGLRLYEVAEVGPDVAAWLGSLGLARETSLTVQFGGAMTLGHTLFGPVFGHGQPILMKVSGVQNGRSVRVAAKTGETVVLPSGGMLSIRDAAPGEHVLEVAAGSDLARVGFTVVLAEPATVVLEVATDPVTPSADDLIEGRLAIHVRSSVPLRDTEVTVAAVGIDGTIAQVSARIAASQVTFAAHSDLLTLLANELQCRVADRTHPFDLAVSIGGSWTWRTQLGWTLRECQWECIEDEWRALTEERELPVVLNSGSAPLAPYALSPEPDAAVTLRTPILDGIPLVRDALCTAPSRMSLGRPEISMPARVLREATSRGGGVGLLPSLGSWLAWASARPQHVLADVGRRRVARALEEVAVEQLCGREWADREKTAAPLGETCWAALAEISVKRGLAAGGMLPDVPTGEEPRLALLLAKGFESALPLLCEDEYEPDAEEAAADLDMVVIDAWERLSDLRAADGLEPFEDPDANGGSEAWAEAVAEARQRHVGAQLAKLLLPASRSQALTRLDYRSLAEADLAAMLSDTHVDLQLRPPFWLGADDLDAALRIWTNPRSVLARPGWERHAERLLADRQSARAARYVALRHRSARGVEHAR